MLARLAALTRGLIILFASTQKPWYVHTKKTGEKK
jgi:hypothetical protein